MKERVTDFRFDSPILLKKSDRFYIFLAIIISFFSWMIFKNFYPYPNLTFDSYHYLMNMHLGTNAAGWPVGYSKLLKYVGYISHSVDILLDIQFFITQLGYLLFFITLRMFFSLNKWTSLIIFIFLFFNPINVYNCNHLLSDPLFIGINMIWISQLLWIIFYFRPFMIFTQALLILLLFDLRYNALYFPILTILVYSVSRIPLNWKINGVGITILLLGCFIGYTSIKMQEISGVKQYAYSNGWKKASNSLYVYEHYYKSDTFPVPAKFSELDSLVRNYFNMPHTKVSLFYPDKEVTLGSYYMAVGGTPLYTYMQWKSGYKDWSLDFHRTAPYGDFYDEYGNYLITHHPMGYIKYVVFPHIVSYITPYPEIFTINPDAFSLWSDKEYGKIARDWFRLTTIQVARKYIEFRAWILYPYPFIYTLIHITFFLALVSFILMKGVKLLPISQLYALITLIAMCIGNFIFTIISTTSVLRYQLAVITIEFSLTIYFIELILSLDNKKKLLYNVNPKK